MAANPELKATLLESRVRYFDDTDRKNTLISFENKELRQIGLDSKEGTQKPLGPKEGSDKPVTYAFSLGKSTENGEKLQLFMTPKIATDKGRIQHSSFLKGGNTLSAGMIVVGKDGKIESIRNQSGHYAPSKAEIASVLKYLKSELSTEDFNKIQLSVNVNTGWRIGVASFAKEKLNMSWGIVEKPAYEWLNNYEKNAEAKNRNTSSNLKESIKSWLKI